MFSIKVKSEGELKKYHVWGPGELVETKKLNDYSYCAVEDRNVDYKIISQNDGLYAVITHQNPQIISDEDLQEYLLHELQKSFELSKNRQTDHTSFYQVKTMPSTSLNENEYRALYEVFSAKKNR